MGIIGLSKGFFLDGTKPLPEPRPRIELLGHNELTIKGIEFFLPFC